MCPHFPDASAMKNNDAVRILVRRTVGRRVHPVISTRTVARDVRAGADENAVHRIASRLDGRASRGVEPKVKAHLEILRDAEVERTNSDAGRERSGCSNSKLSTQLQAAGRATH